MWLREIVSHNIAENYHMRAFRGFAKKKNSKNPRLLWKWVGGSRSHYFFFIENHPKIALNQCKYFGVAYLSVSVYALLTVVGYSDLSGLSISVMGFPKKEVWIEGGWVL